LAYLVQLVVLGLLIGGVYVAVGIGFGLVWGVLNIVNLAHGALVIVGAYLTWKLFSAYGLDPFLSLPLDAALLFAIGYALQRLLINRIIRAPLLFTFLLTFGVNLVVINVLLFLFKSDFRSVTPSYAGTGLTLGPLVIPYTRLASLAVAILLAGVLALILGRTRTGLAIQAVGSDRDAAQLVGIDLRHTYALTFAIGAACAGVAGGLISLLQALPLILSSIRSRNRSISPPDRSSASPTPVWVDPKIAVCTKIPGIRKSMYFTPGTLMAPPKT